MCNLCYIAFPPRCLFVFMFVLQLCGECHLSNRRRCGCGCLLFKKPYQRLSLTFNITSVAGGSAVDCLLTGAPKSNWDTSTSAACRVG